jgi:phosphate starvation-inducible membrane PsiE
MKLRRVEALDQRVGRLANAIGNVLVDGFHYVALFAIGSAVAWSAVVAFIGMAQAKGHASIDDILLLFIYLELGAMVGIYFRTKHLPVRFLIYVAMTALTRLLIANIVRSEELSALQAQHRLDVGLVWISGAILLLAVAALVLRYGSARDPGDRD